ncbi:MAG: biotin/lipoyl-containing protein [Myxococcota bacterium]
MKKNRLVHANRRLGDASSDWVRSFNCEDVKPLIVCRGPIRQEALDVFHEMGMTRVGILLSEKDSIVYPGALAPEVRGLPPGRVHMVEDYTGATKEARDLRMAEIVGICREHGYDTVFAGYGFMSEDSRFVAYLEDAGLTFMGPGSATQRAAGMKDEAKRTAQAERVSVTPGVDDLTTRLLLHHHPDRDALDALVAGHELDVDGAARDHEDLHAYADAVLRSSLRRGIDLFTIDELAAQVEREVRRLFEAHPGRRIRLKAIGGGGGKGQRILSAPASPKEAAAAAQAAPALAREVLAEVKATGVGDDKNMLLELNIEQTRHNEIQLLGNGTWCVALGGRDCSLQMHEQKLLEVSVTREELERAETAAEAAGRTAEASSLRQDRETLARMEDEGRRFGRAVGLDSASTFECIVEGDRHYFMEVNTRIQVEHRVSELCYGLRFENPAAPDDHFVVTSLVEAMALCARHKDRLPEPHLVPREGAALEARLNATNDALQPHAGGRIRAWSPPLPYEVRDAQGICAPNPDTGRFMHYVVAGAYDSNIALLVTSGNDRRESFTRLREVLRATKLRGSDLATNLHFHYGLTSWLLGWNVWAKPTTRFVVPYLTQVGRLAEAAQDLDVDHALARLQRDAEAKARRDGARAERTAAIANAFRSKSTLIGRPLRALFSSPHVHCGWLATFRDRFDVRDGRLRWRSNPLRLLCDTYRYLNMERWPGAPAAYVIWDHDQELLDTGLAFYEALASRMGHPGWPALTAALAAPMPPAGFDATLWAAVQAAHEGHQFGLDALGLAAMAGCDTDFFALRVDDDLSCIIPENLLDPDLQARMLKVLAPPPTAGANEVVAATGGMFYAQEAPGKPPFIDVGMHFDAGQPLYIIEVMKMFNRIAAPFAGTIDEVLIPGGEGVIVKKGQPLFRVTPDERIATVDPAEIARARRTRTDRYLEALRPVPSAT